MRDSWRALSGGVTTDAILDMVADIRNGVRVPLVFMTYGNIVYHYGVRRFCDRARRRLPKPLVLAGSSPPDCSPDARILIGSSPRKTPGHVSATKLNPSKTW